jgi:hypothetical protein
MWLEEKCTGLKDNLFALRFNDVAFTDLYARKKSRNIQMWNYSIENNPLTGLYTRHRYEKW